MRQSLLNTFTEIYIFNLHGNSKKKEVAPDGSKDENVFDIQQGVTISIFIKEAGKTSHAKVHYADLWGKREGKYLVLAETDINLTKWNELEPTSPHYLFVPQDINLLSEYEKGWKITDISPINSTGIVTARDGFVIGLEQASVQKRLEIFLDKKLGDTEVQNQLSLSENYMWRVTEARKQLMAINDWESFFKRILYRPFDYRSIYYHPSVVWRTRSNVMRHMMAGNNIGLYTNREVNGEFHHILCSRDIINDCTVSLQTKERTYIFPLYLYPVEGEMQLDKGNRRPNFNSEFIKVFSEKLGLKFIEDGKGDLQETFGPEDIFNYAYAVFHSPDYRSRYVEFLRRDFPRLPLTSDKVLFKLLAEKGATLVSLHLMESPLLNNLITKYEVKGDHTVDKVNYDEKTQRVSINKTQCFEGVPPEVWNFHIGGYPVCEKWLKDRKGRKLTIDDIAHYQEIVVALKETIRLMQEIDEAIESHGGWPVAFD